MALYHRSLGGAVAGALMLTGMAWAQDMPGSKPADRRQRAGAIATKPLVDTNIKRPAIPPALTAIADDPYSLRGIATCAEIATAVRALDAVLSPDVDSPGAPKKGDVDKAIDVAGSVVGSLIPFGGIVREVSGANAARQRYALAVLDGYARRGFLKGIGRQRGCKAPAAPLGKS